MPMLRLLLLVLVLFFHTANSAVANVMSATTSISISAPTETIIEGNKRIVRITRKGSRIDDNLAVKIRLSGSATLHNDYELSGIRGFTVTSATVIIPAKQLSTDLAIIVVDDIAAEAAEKIILSVAATSNYHVDDTAHKVTFAIPANDVTVTTTSDAGEGSLRQAIYNATSFAGPNTITFFSESGPFAEDAQTIQLKSPLPELTSELIIDGRMPGKLWRRIGVTIDGKQLHQVFQINAGANVTIQALTIADGHANNGGGLLNQGYLILKDSTLVGNTAINEGGAVANIEGTLQVINSTFFNNAAGNNGGGISNHSDMVITNSTFSGNGANNGGGVFNNGMLLLRNTIVANNKNKDCVNAAVLDTASTHNLIEDNDRCGTPISTANPELTGLNYYNGPTPTLGIKGGSPTINLGDNASALDEHGQPLVWDQRGNGDPRFVGGITDIGAFEHQDFPKLVVDTVEDTELRACTTVSRGDCSLRGAINLANASKRDNKISFDTFLFAEPQAIILTRALPAITEELLIDGSNSAVITVKATQDFEVFRSENDAKLLLKNITIERSSR